jgi:hypothetical protein
MFIQIDCPRDYCFGTLQPDRMEGDWVCSLCERRFKIEDGQIVPVSGLSAASNPKIGGNHVSPGILYPKGV